MNDRNGESLPVQGVRHSPATMARLAIEFVILFIAGPLVVAFTLPTGLLIPSIVVFGLVALVLLLADRSFDRKQLWNWRNARREMPRMLILLALSVLAVTAMVLIVKPELMLSLVRRNPTLWLAIMLGYPLASVYPQEVIYRALIFHRYRPLFPSSAATAIVSAFAFAYAHIVLWNLLAIIATLIGGGLFAYTYHRTRSVAATALEHALYGCFMFTVGLGQFFYAGGVR